MSLQLYGGDNGNSKNPSVVMTSSMGHTTT